MCSPRCGGERVGLTAKETLWTGTPRKRHDDAPIRPGATAFVSFRKPKAQRDDLRWALGVGNTPSYGTGAFPLLNRLRWRNTTADVCNAWPPRDQIRAGSAWPAPGPASP